MIDPTEITTIRVGELPVALFNLTDNVPHEVGQDLKKGTIEDLAIFIGSYIGASDGVGFRAISVTDGQTLPTTTNQEFILVGKGTYYNVSGGATLVLTEELNAIVSNGSFWFIGVEIPVNVELAGITQFIRDGFTTTTPSENAVFDAMSFKLDKGTYTGTAEDLNNSINSILNTRPPASPFKFIQKGFGNTNQNQNEIGDIFCGWKNDGTIRFSESKWLGGALNNSDNFIPLVQTEI